MKFKQGYLQNMNGEIKPIVVEGKMSSIDILIGAGLIGCGVSHLIKAAFKGGSKAHEMAEYKTMVDLGIIEE